MILQLLVCQSATGKLEKQHSSLFNDCHVILGNCPLSILAFHYCSITSSKISPFILLTYLDTGNVFLYRIIPGAGGNRGLAATISRSVVDKYFPFVRAAGKSSRCTIRGDSTQSFLYGRWMKALCGIARRGGGGGREGEKLAIPGDRVDESGTYVISCVVYCVDQSYGTAEIFYL